MSEINRINSGASLPLASNLSVNRQTPDLSFGKRVQAGVQATSSVIGSGLGIAGSSFAGGPAVVSAALSSTMALSGNRSTGAVNTTYVAAGNSVTASLGGGSPNPTALSLGGGSGGSPALEGAMAANGETNLVQLLEMQTQLQRENQVFSSISNSLKTRHDTAKNSIANIK